MTKFVARFSADESGATAIEYGLIAGAMAVALIAFMPTFTTALTTMFNGLSSALGSNTPSN